MDGVDGRHSRRILAPSAVKDSDRRVQKVDTERGGERERERAKAARPKMRRSDAATRSA